MPIVFNGVTREIEVTDSSIFSLDVERDVYSEWKRWSQLGTNGKYAPALRTFGGDGTAPGQIAPKYFFFQNFWRMRINNGNVVSVGLNLYTDNYVTPYVVVPGSGVSDRNSDAVSVNSEDIQFASYQGVITVDIANISGRATAGTTFPIGTPRRPVNNLIDAYIISQQVGLFAISVIGDLDVNAGGPWTGYKFIGEGTTKTTIDVAAAADVLRTEYTNAFVTGTLDGNSVIKSGELSNLNFVDGEVKDCFLGPGIIVLGTSNIANIVNCFSAIPGPNSPTIDMNETGILGLRGYKGGVLLTNYNGNSAHSIDLDSGQCRLDSATITSGTFVVRGEGKLVDELGNRILPGTWNGGVTIINETSDMRNHLLEEVHKVLDLNKDHEVTRTKTSTIVDDINIQITGDGENISISERQ